jgi:hypothetical protein
MKNSGHKNNTEEFIPVRTHKFEKEIPKVSDFILMIPLQLKLKNNFKCLINLKQNANL